MALLLVLLGVFGSALPVRLNVEVDEEAEDDHDDGQEEVDDEVGVLAADTERVHVVEELHYELRLLKM